MKLSDFMQPEQGQQAGAAAQAMSASYSEEEEKGKSVNDQDEALGSTEEPTPEEQEMYERIVAAGLKVISEASDQVLKMLQASADNPPQALSDTAWAILAGIDEKAGGQLDEGILLAAGAEVIENLGELAVASGLFDVSQPILDQAYQIALQRFSDEFGGDFIEDFQQDIQSLSPDQQSALIAKFQGA